MSHRGSIAAHENAWAKSQRRIGNADAFSGRSVVQSDQYYLRGYREGAKRRAAIAANGACLARQTAFAHHDVCYRAAKADWLDTEFSGEWVPVCGTHGKVAERRGYAVKWR